MVGVLGGVGDRYLHPLDATGELVPARPVVLRDRRAGIAANIASVVRREDHRGRGRDLARADLLAVDVEGRGSAFAETSTLVGKLHPHLVIAWRQRACRID